MASFRGQFEDAGFVIQVLSRVLAQLIDVNQKSNTRQHFVTKFQSSYAPGISILGYLERIYKYAKCSPNCFVVALIYIDRLIEIRNIVLTSLNVHRILITSVLISTKVFDDDFYKNAYYAKLGGVSTTELNSLELEFLSLVNFNLFVSTDSFEKYQNELRSFVSVSPTLNSAVSVTFPPYSHESGSSMHPVADEQMAPLEGCDACSGLFSRPLLPDEAGLTSFVSPPCVSSTSSFFLSSNDCGSSQSLADPSISQQISFGVDSGVRFAEYGAIQVGGSQLAGHHHQRHIPCPPAPFTSCFEVDASSYSSPFSANRPGDGHSVDSFPLHWSAGVARSHQTYPSCTQQSFFAPPQRSLQVPYYNHGSGGGAEQGYPNVVYYPPPTTTPTSVADAFRPSCRFPSPAPYYDCAASPHIPPHQIAPMQSHLQPPCRVIAPPGQQPSRIHRFQKQQSPSASCSSHMHCGVVAQQLQPPYPFGQRAVASTSDCQFPVAVRSS